MTQISQYFELHHKHKLDYGEKSILVMQVGSFYEMYGVKTHDGSYCETDIDEWSRVSDLNIAGRSNVNSVGALAKHGGGTIVMIGCKLEQFDKYVPRFQKAGYTLVVYEQHPENKQKRIFVQVISPGTVFSTEETATTNNAMCVWCEGYKNTFTTRHQKNGRLMFGVAVIDSLTGKSSLSEFSEEFKQEMHTTYNELERLVSIHRPRELIFISNLHARTIEDILRFVQPNCLSLHTHSLHQPITDAYTLSCVDKLSNCERQSYQETILNSTFKPANLDQFMSAYRDNPVGTQALTYLLDFVASRNSKLLENITNPVIEIEHGRLILENHSLRQLNIIDDGHKGKHSSVLKLLNKAITNMGKREIESNLLNPITGIQTLEREYCVTANTMECWSQMSEIRHILRKVCDIDKLRRMISIEKVPYPSLNDLVETTDAIKETLSLIPEDGPLPEYLGTTTDLAGMCDRIAETIKGTFDIGSCQQLLPPSKVTTPTAAIQNPTFSVKPGINEELDELRLELKKEIDSLTIIQEYLCHSIHEIPTEGKTRAIKINETEKQGLTLGTSKKRGEAIMAAQKKGRFPQLPHSKFDFIIEGKLLDSLSSKAGSTKTDVVLTCDETTRICNSIGRLREGIQNKITSIYREFITEFKSRLGILGTLAEYVTRLDSVTTKAYVAKKYNYCRPTLVEEESSFVRASGLRHCLIEHISTTEAYVTNDVHLGCDIDNDSCTGFLLFGTNTVGKTSLIRAVGIAVVMAQSGFFVPCSSMRLSPYQQIFTRILNTDNLFRGQSTFMVEMCELRRILMKGNNRSLVLGDELCSGTEIDSAISLFTAGLIQLHNIQANFIFATHLHMITTQPQLMELPGLKYKHLTVTYDAAGNRLIYDRKLKDGQGSSLYGLEVCKSLDLPEDFVRLANQVRESNSRSILASTSSRYNSVIKGQCMFCGSPASAIHHLVYQSDADDDGFICADGRTFHKNHPANTVPICEECHLKVHKDDKRYVQKKTSDGMALVEKSVQ